MKLADVTPAVRRKIAELLGLESDAVLRHIQMGRRRASADMAIRIERASKAAGAEVRRETLCDACRGCDLAKKARKAA